MNEPHPFHIRICAALLAGTAFALAALRLGNAQPPEEGRTSLWRLRCEVIVEPSADPVRIVLHAPLETDHARLAREELSRSGLHAVRILRRKANQVVVLGHGPREQRVTLTAQYDIALDPQPPPGRTAPGRDRLDTAEREARLRLKGRFALQPDQAADILRRIDGETPGSKQERILHLFRFCHEDILPVAGGSPPRSADQVLGSRRGSPAEQALAFTALCRAARHPARMVTGFVLEENQNLQPHHWVDVRLDDRWLPFDPCNGYAGSIPPAFLPVAYDSEVVSVSNGATGHVSFACRALPSPGDRRGVPTSLAATGPIDLRRLPLATRDTVTLLLLLPCGALLTTVARVLIGVRTFGTFTPSLLALALLGTDLGTVLSVLAAVLLAALLARALIERLRLLMVPRLGFMLTVIVLVLTGALVLLDRTGDPVRRHPFLLPLVILVMLVERLFVTDAEDGWREALRLALQTAAVSAGCYALLRWRTLGALLLTFPELHLLTLAAFLLLGRYAGYRLTELWRFRDLANLPTHPPQEGTP